MEEGGGREIIGVEQEGVSNHHDRSVLQHWIGSLITVVVVAAAAAAAAARM